MGADERRSQDGGGRLRRASRFERILLMTVSSAAMRMAHLSLILLCGGLQVADVHRLHLDLVDLFTPLVRRLHNAVEMV